MRIRMAMQSLIFSQSWEILQLDGTATAEHESN